MVINLKIKSDHCAQSTHIYTYATYFDRLPMQFSQIFADALLRVRGCAFKGTLSGNLSLSKTVSGVGNTKTDQTETL